MYWRVMLFWSKSISVEEVRISSLQIAQIVFGRHKNILDLFQIVKMYILYIVRLPDQTDIDFVILEQL